LTEGKGVPVACIVSGANRTDMKKLGDLLDALMIAMPPVPDETPDEERPQLCLDRGYAYDACRDTARAHGYVPHIPPKASAAQPLPRPVTPPAIRPGAGSSRSPTPGSTASAACSSAGRRRRTTTSAWCNSPPSSSSIANCAMLTYFPDRVYAQSSIMATGVAATVCRLAAGGPGNNSRALPRWHKGCKMFHLNAPRRALRPQRSFSHTMPVAAH